MGKLQSTTTYPIWMSVNACISLMHEAARTTLPARVMAAPSTSSSFLPRDEGSGKRTSKPMTSGFQALMRSMSWPCRRRGKGQGSFSSLTDASSIETMTIGAVGARLGRSSKRLSSDRSSSHSTDPL